jgi:hypothetical protein
LRLEFDNCRCNFTKNLEIEKNICLLLGALIITKKKIIPTGETERSLVPDEGKEDIRNYKKPV